VNDEPEIHVERLVKSSERVRDLGEVFTPRQIVDDMLDLLPKEMWAVDPSPTFLEPACGDGNFLVAILERKLNAVASAWKKGNLPAGDSHEGLAFHCLQAAASIYGVDISEHNIVGGVPEHPIGARSRMEAFLAGHLEANIGKTVRNDSKVLQSARWIFERNIQIANMLKMHADGSPSYRDELPLTVYEWLFLELKVTVSTTTLGDITASAEQQSAEAPSLFGGREPEPLWAGAFDELHRIQVQSTTNARATRAAA
jgi:hypothetical protein